MPRAGVTLREGDPTLKDIAYGSTTQIASRAIFTLDVAGAGSAERDRFVSAITAAATTKGWLPAAPGTTPKVQTTITGDSLTLEINTDVAMEMPTPQYGKNAVVWGMFLLSKGLGALGATAADMQLKKAADGIADLFFRDGVEGEAYIGKYMGIPASLLRNPSNGTPNLTFALMGGINSETPTSFYTDASGSLSMPMFVRSMHVTAADSGQATAAVTAAFQAKGFTIGTLGSPDRRRLVRHARQPADGAAVRELPRPRSTTTRRSLRIRIPSGTWPIRRARPVAPWPATSATR